jgi:hypothetical protein
MAPPLGFPYGLPGQDSLQQTVENAFLVGKESDYQLAGGIILSTAVDAGATPTTELRNGLVMGQVTASGKWREYAATNTDGSQIARRVLFNSRRMTDYDANALDRWGVFVVRGLVRPTALYGLDEKARRDLSLNGFLFDDRPNVPGAYYGTTPKTANYTVTAADNGTHFTTLGAGGAVQFTLPTVAAGLRYRFTNCVDQNMTVAGAAGTLITFNNAAATSVAFSTASNKIGGSFEVVSDSAGAKWLVLPHGANTMTVA